MAQFLQVSTCQRRPRKLTSVNKQPVLILKKDWCKKLMSRKFLIKLIQLQLVCRF